MVVADDRITADDSYGLACQGVGLLWKSDFQNARQMLQAMARRADRPPRKPAKPTSPVSPGQAFHLYRQSRAQRARTLGMLLIPLDAEGVTSKDAAARLKLHPYFVQKLYAQTRNYSERELLDATVRPAELDHAPEAAVEQALLAIVAQANQLVVDDRHRLAPAGQLARVFGAYAKREEVEAEAA